jgi:hypothetical protein
MAYGCGFGLRAGSCLVGETRGKEETEVRAADVLMLEIVFITEMVGI